MTKNDSDFGHVMFVLIFAAIAVIVFAIVVNSCINSGRDDCIRSGGKFYNGYCHMEGSHGKD